MQHSSGHQKAEDEADKEAEEKMREIKEIGKKGGSKVVDDLLKAVTDVHPEAPDRVSASSKE